MTDASWDAITLAWAESSSGQSLEHWLWDEVVRVRAERDRARKLLREAAPTVYGAAEDCTNIHAERRTMDLYRRMVAEGGTP